MARKPADFRVSVRKGTLVPGNTVSSRDITNSSVMWPELLFLRHLHSGETWSPDQHSARLQLGPLRHILIARIACVLTAIAAAFLHPWAALTILLAADILELQLFFQSVEAPKMPGNFGQC